VTAGTNTITAVFTIAHAINVPVRTAGAFASGIVPENGFPVQGVNMTHGSDGSTLKLYGDINDDGNMEYIEYWCDTTGGNLYRNVVTVAAGAAKNAVGPSMIVLSNIQSNPPDPGASTPAPCFKYQEKSFGGNSYVVDVSVTLTVQTQNLDPQTRQFQRETKALLNVSPRNVFEGWQLASAGVGNRIQPMPADSAGLNVAGLLP
jgi:hypothetical protein